MTVIQRNSIPRRQSQGELDSCYALPTASSQLRPKLTRRRWDGGPSNQIHSPRRLGKLRPTKTLNMPADNPHLPSTHNANSELAQANKRISSNLERVFDNISESDGASQRADWKEVQKMAELIIMDGLVYGMDETPDPPPPNVNPTPQAQGHEEIRSRRPAHDRRRIRPKRRLH